jgi:hypothetical protein
LTKGVDFFVVVVQQKSIKDTRKEREKGGGQLTGRHKHNYSYYIFFLK